MNEVNLTPGDNSLRAVRQDMESAILRYLEALAGQPDNGRATHSPNHLPEIMSPKQLAVALDVSVRTLERWREGKQYSGPRFQHPAGTKIYRYYKQDVLDWLENKEPSDELERVQGVHVDSLGGREAGRRD